MLLCAGAHCGADGGSRACVRVGRRCEAERPEVARAQGTAGAAPDSHAARGERVLAPVPMIPIPIATISSVSHRGGSAIRQLTGEVAGGISPVCGLATWTERCRSCQRACG